MGATAILLARYPDEEKLDAQGRLLMPGNICAHTHFYGAFARGLAIPGPAPRNFPEILRKLWWPLDKSLTRHDWGERPLAPQHIRYLADDVVAEIEGVHQKDMMLYRQALDLRQRTRGSIDHTSRPVLPLGLPDQGSG
jgi:hypothetical protein